MSSTTVTNTSENTKTPNTAATTTGHPTRRGGPVGLSAPDGSPGPPGPGGPGGGGICWVTAGSAVWSSTVASVAVAVAAALVAVPSVGAEDSPGVVSVVPAASVNPRWRSSLVFSGTRTLTCLTAWFVRSIDWKTRAVPVVAATEPMATPMMVPLTPNTDAMTADSTAPPAEARICR
jgi:hypothetical protein